MTEILFIVFFFFFNDTATTDIYTLSLPDALPISFQPGGLGLPLGMGQERARHAAPPLGRDRKSTRLNSSHGYISYAVFCLKKKKKNKKRTNIKQKKNKKT